MHSARAEDQAEVAAPADSTSRWGVSFGLGLDARWRREINPAFGEYKPEGQLFTTVRYDRFGLSFELERGSPYSSRTGGLQINTSTVTAGAWGRYAFRGANQWVPFASLGAGAQIDRVRTTFQNTVDERRGTKRFVGVGAGLTEVFFKYLVVEAEARVSSLEETKSPGLSMVLRVGVTL